MKLLERVAGWRGGGGGGGGVWERSQASCSMFPMGKGGQGLEGGGFGLGWMGGGGARFGLDLGKNLRLDEYKRR
eukprot:1237831-Amorphochlora_amoeboformis.AAC.1